jgi:hypothetical protein
MNTAQIILQQLGGRRFQAMTGAKNFIALSDGALSFRLPSTPHYVKNGVNAVKISLNVSDLYDLEFSRIYGTKQAVKHIMSDVYADELQAAFTMATGLDTHL